MSNNKSAAVQTSELWVKGKTFRLFKRDPATGRPVDKGTEGWKDLPYNFRFTFRGKSYARCLEINDEEEAQKQARLKAKAIIASVVGGEHAKLDHTKTRVAASCTLQDLLEAYSTAPIDAEAKTRKQNCFALRQFMRNAVGISEETPGRELTLQLNQIDGEVSHAWFTAASKRALEATQQSEKISIKRSANSRFTQAKSLFTPKALAIYRKLGIYYPGFEAFVKEGETFKFTKLPTSGFAPANESVIEATLKAWEKIGAAGDVSEGDRNLFLAIGQELAFGLRTGELAQATWSWWTSREGYPVLDNCNQNVTVKNNTGMISVQAVDPWFTIMSNRIKARGWNLGPDGQMNKAGFILAGTPTARKDTTFRDVSAFLRKHGWTTGKTNHELRKYVGSQIAMRYGIYDAQRWLRHSSVNVTEQNYSGYVRKFKPADVTTLAVRYASLTPESPVLRIVNAPE